MATYILRVTSANNTKNIPISRLMALRTEPGAKYAILDSNGQLAQGITLTQKESTLTVEAGGQKLVYLNGYYAPGVNATIETGSGMTASASGASSAAPIVSEPVANTPSVVSTTVESESASVGSASGSSGGWMSGAGLGGNTGMLLLGGVAVAGIAAAAAGGGGGGGNSGGGSTPTTGPNITGISLSATGSADQVLIKNDVVSVTVAMSANTTVTGNPTLKINIGGTEVDAIYASGSGTQNLVFTYTIQSNQADANGISLTAGEISLPAGASLKDSSGKDAVRTFAALTDQSTLKVDAITPEAGLIALSSANTSGTLVLGDKLTIDVSMSEVSKVTQSTDGKWPQLQIKIGEQTVLADFETSSNNSQILRFSYVLPAGLSDTDGVSIVSNSLVLNGAGLADNYGNRVSTISTSAVADNTNFKVDSSVPVATLFNPVPTLLEATGVSNGGDYVPQIIHNSDGSFIVAWRSELQSAQQQALHIQKFNADGRKSNIAALQIDAYDGLGDFDFAPSLTALGSEGQFAATWTALNNQGTRDIVVQKFNADLTSASRVVLASFEDSYDTNDRPPQIIQTKANGDFAVVWDAFDEKVSFSNPSPSRSIFVQQFNSDGSKKSSNPVKLDAPGTGNGAPKVTSIGTQGELLVTWLSKGDDHIYAQKIAADGSKVTPIIQLDAGAEIEVDPSVSKLGSSGAVVVAWTGFESSTDSSIFVQKFDSSGNKVGSSPIILEATGRTDANDNSAQVISLGSSEEFVVVWSGVNSEGGSKTSIFVQKFNAQGEKTGSAVQLNAEGYTSGVNSAPIVKSIGSDGRFVLAWTAVDPTGTDTSIYVQRFDASGVPTGSQVKLEATGQLSKNDSAPQISTNASTGEFVVTWQGIDRQGDSSVFVQKFNSNGQPDNSQTADKLLNANEFVTVQSTKKGLVYFVHESVTTPISKVSDITSLGAALWKQSNIDSANTNATTSLVGLAGTLGPGQYNIYTADEFGNLSAAATNHFIINAVKQVSLTRAVDGASQQVISAGSLNNGDTVEATVTFSENVTVTTSGTNRPFIQLNIGGQIVDARYASGSGTDKLVFQYTLQSMPSDTNGISIVADSLNLNGGSIKLANGINAPVGFSFVDNNASYAVDNQAPSGAIMHGDASTLALGSNLTIYSDDTSVAYLVLDKGTAINSIADITALASNEYKVVNDVLPNSDASLPTTGLSAGTYHLYLADYSGNLSSVSKQSVEISASNITVHANPTVVIFDLVEGVSSAHSGRTFSANTSYTIYVNVAPDSSILSSDGSSLATWGAWAGANNLGSDDKIVLVGFGIKGKAGGYLSDFAAANNVVDWKTSKAGLAAKLAGDGVFSRMTANATHVLDLWAGTWNQANQGLNMSNVHTGGLHRILLGTQGVAQVPTFGGM